MMVFHFGQILQEHWVIYKLDLFGFFNDWFNFLTIFTAGLCFALFFK